MAKGVERLSPLFVQRVKEPGLHGDGAGLWLQVSLAGKDGTGKPRLTKSWVYRFMLNGRARSMGLGPFYDVPLAEARELARAARKLVRSGIDPIDARKAQMQALALEAARSITFKKAAEDFIELHRSSWTNARSAEQWTNSLAAYAYPVFGAWPVQAVDTPAVLKAIEPIWTSKTTTAERVRNRIENILDWATTRGYRQKGENPARWRGHLEHSLPAPRTLKNVEHHAALPYAEISAFMKALRSSDAMSARALELLVLTATRANETLGARWSEIDETAKVWEIPKERMKGKAGKRRPHRVPLSEPALKLIATLRKPSDGYDNFLFANGTSKLPDKTMDDLLRRLGYARDKVTVHGFRASFRSWASEQTTVPREICEQALAHVTADATEAAYARTDFFEKRRHLMNDWAAHCGRPAYSGVVTKLHARAAAPAN